MIKRNLLAFTLLCLAASTSFAQSIVAVNPDTVYQGQSLVLSITGQGTNFYQATQATQATGTSWLTRGIDAIFPVVNTVQGPTQMTSGYTIPGNAAIGYWDVHVMDGSGELILNDGVYVDFIIGVNPAGLDIRESITVSPNPITDRFAINYTLPEWADVEVMVMELNGRNIRSLLKKQVGPGSHKESFNLYGLSLASENFLVVLRVNDMVFATKATIIR